MFNTIILQYRGNIDVCMVEKHVKPVCNNTLISQLSLSSWHRIGTTLFWKYFDQQLFQKRDSLIKMARFNRSVSRSTMKVIGGSSHPGKNPLIFLHFTVIFFHLTNVDYYFRTDRVDCKKSGCQILQDFAGEIRKQWDKRATDGPSEVPGCLHHSNRFQKYRTFYVSLD